MARRLFTLLSALSLMLCAVVLVVSANSYDVMNGHREVYVYGQPAGGFMAWFLFGDELLHQTPAELVMYASMVLPLLWLACDAIRPAQRLLHYRRTRLLREGRCPKCGYDLRATPGRCPECGRAAAEKVA